MSHTNLFEANGRSLRPLANGYFQGLSMPRGPAHRQLDPSASATSLNSVSSVNSAFRTEPPVSLSSLGYPDHLLPQYPHPQQALQLQIQQSHPVQSHQRQPQQQNTQLQQPQSQSQPPQQQQTQHHLQQQQHQQQQQHHQQQQQQQQQHQQQHPWPYAATVNGAVNGSSRRPTRRQPLPQTWPDPLFMGMGHQGFPGTLSTPVSISSFTSDLEQLIPTAIVIKNIPFAVRKELLSAVMMDLNLPQPYAFNYHFDNGVFRGLAFANFQSPDDTRLVIEAMNGIEVQGRKLRVEYKKMLPEVERERIEREKRERRGQLEEQHRAPLSLVRNSPIRDIDLNDPQTLGFYTELEVFRRDEHREILIFPTTVPPEQRRLIHILAHHMGLEHQSVGDAEDRQIHVLKRRIPSPTAPINPSPSCSSASAAAAAAAAAAIESQNKRGLSRAATFDFASDSRPAAAHFAPSRLTLELPGSPDGSNLNLRAAKSFIDLRSYSPSPSQASSSYLNGTAMHFGTYTATDPLLMHSSSVANMFEALPPRQQPPPGAIGSQRNLQSSRNSTAPERHTRGSEWTALGFRRHIPRESDAVSLDRL